ncbi:MAG TPA: YihY/virulence factor BrkB family protein [Terriglobales bacterium]|jgi:membrane protein|nr:YihY/virulence factor BrkB family protein [Terriglobales bacterium]
MRWLRIIKRTAVQTWRDLNSNHTMALAAGLSYYFVMSLFPLLIVAAAAVAFLPVPNLFEQILGVMARVVPEDSMGLVRAIVGDVITPKRATFLSLGVLGTLWTASSGFAAMIEALNVAYDVPETRPIWKTRLLALGLSFLNGGLLVTALLVMLVGPRFGDWLAGKLGLSWMFAAVWPVVRWIVAISFTVLAVEITYFLGPNVKQRFRCTLPGAVFAVGAWIALSYLLGLYFQSFANFNATYGTLGAAVALMIWLYWSGFAILIGAEINAELLQAAGEGKLPLKHPPPRKVYPTEPPKEADEVAA